MAKKDCLIIGITGGSGSGKTTFANKLYSNILKIETVNILCQDDFYKDQSNVLPDKRHLVNFDHPSTVDFLLLHECIKQLSEGKTSTIPQYNFKTHTRIRDGIIMESANILLVEGIHILSSPALNDIFDLKIFLDASDDIRFIRRLQRDIETRGRTTDDVINQYLTCVKPMFEEYVKPIKTVCDIIVPSNKNFDSIINMLTTTLTNGNSVEK